MTQTENDDSGFEATGTSMKIDSIKSSDEELRKSVVDMELSSSRDNALPSRNNVQLDAKRRAITVLQIVVKLAVVLTSLYLFICSLSLLANAFRLLAGRRAGEIFRHSEFFNPVSGVLVGVLVTVLVQSSSTSTTIFITMAAAELLTVKQAIPLVMGANIGTSVTSTIVALGQAAKRDEFARAFAAATVHDMFNFLTVGALLPLEVFTGYLHALSLALVNFFSSDGELEQGDKPPDVLKALTKPFVAKLISIDKNVIAATATASTEEQLAAVEERKMLKHLLGNSDLDDSSAGIITLLLALIMLCTTLFVVVCTLKSLLKGRAAQWLHASVNGEVPDLRLGRFTIPLRWLSGYLGILSGCVITLLVQSSSVTTATLTPLVGIGVISLERVYPVVLGANIGTCFTGLLAALAADASRIHITLQVAFAHLLFNINGIIIWYMIWPARALPIGAARYLGGTTAKYRWFAVAYLLVCFFVIPIIIMLLSISGPEPLIAFLVTVALALFLALLLNEMQKRCPYYLPLRLRSWHFLPPFLTSLEPYDRLICGQLSRLCCKCSPSSADKHNSLEPLASSNDVKVG